MSRTLPAPTLALLAGANRAHHQRLWIGPPGEALIDLTDYLLPGTVHEEGINEPIDALTLVLDRSLGSSSLSPLMTADPPVDLNHDVVWEVAVTSQTVAPTSGDWIELFRGSVWDIDATHNAMVVTCQGLAGKLQERLTLAGQTIDADTELEAAIQEVLDGPTPAIGVTLAVPVSPGASLDQGLAVTHQPVLRAALDLAGSIGWTARYWWDEYEEEFLFTLLEPPRDKVTPDWSTSASRYIAVPEFRKSKADVRNSVTVFYGPPDADGLQASVTASDAESIEEFGLLEAFLREGSDSPIQNEAQAQALANAFISDMAWPDVTHTIVDFDLPQIRLWDLIELAPNDVHYNTTQQYAVQTIRREFPTLGAARITLGLRGKPSAGVGTWRRRQTTATAPSYVVQFASDAEGTGASLEYDPEIHTHTRHSYDGGATWTEWAPIVGTMILDVQRVGVVGDQVYYRVTFIDGITAKVFWKIFDEPLPDDHMVEVVRAENLRETITESGTEFTVPWPGKNQALRGVVIPFSGSKVAGDGWEFKANGDDPFIGIDQPMFLESTDGLKAEFRVGIADPRGVVSGVSVFLVIAGIQSGPYPATFVGGRYSFTFNLHPHHQTILRVRVGRNDGGDPIWLGPYTADTNKVPGIPVTRESRNGDQVTIRVDSHDTDTVTQWRREVAMNGSVGAETQIPALGSDPRFGSFTVTASPTGERVFRVYGKNASGVVGPYAEVRVGRFDDFAAELGDVENALDALATQIGEFTQDGSISQAEAIAIGRLRDTLAVQFDELEAEYEQLYVSPLLSGTPKTNLAVAWGALSVDHGELVDAITAIATVGKIASETIEAYESALADYQASLKTFKQRASEAQAAIRSAEVAEGVEEAKDFALGLVGPLGAIIVSDSPPTMRPGGAGLQPGDQWVHTDEPGSDFPVPYFWSGTVWVKGGVDASVVFGTLQAGVVFAGVLEAVTGTFTQLTILEDGWLRSSNYVAGESGYQLTDTHAEFNSVTIRDQVNKTMRIPGTAFVPETSSDGWVRYLDSITPAGVGSVEFTAPIVLPRGAVVTEFRARMRAASTSDTAFVQLIAIGNNGATNVLGLVAPDTSNAGAFATEAAIVADFLVGDETYLLAHAELFNVTTGTGDMRLMWVEVDYTVENYRQTL